MRLILTICFSMCLLVIACKDKNAPQKPENLMSEDKMVDVLIDLSLLSSAKGVNKKVIENNGITPDAYVYKKHGIDSLQFSTSNAYYAYFIDDYDQIYTRVKDSLERLKIKYVRLEEKENSKKKNSKTVKKEPNRVNADSLRKRRNDSQSQPPTPYDD